MGKDIGRGATALLAEFIAASTYDDIPVDVRETVLRHVVDQLGVQLASSSLPWSMAVRAYALQHGPAGPALVVGSDRRLDAEYAALVNASSGHGFEMDDYCSGTMAHPGCVAVPVGLAVGEELGATGEDLMLAATLGFELIVRMARATMPSLLRDRGFHETSVHGVIGAAAAAARLSGLDAGKTLMALSLAGSHASGVAEYTQTGGEVKRFHAGLASSAGIRSVRLAHHGVTGPPTALEGRRGVLQAFSPEPRVEALTEGLGDRWVLTEHLAIKPYACAASINCALEGLDEVMGKQHLAWTDIASIRVGASTHTLRHIGSVGPEPRDMTQAQFSMQFSLALRAVKGANDFRTYMDAAAHDFRDEDVLSMARRVTFEYDDDVETALSQGARYYLGKLSVETVDGRRFATRHIARGSNLPASVGTIEPIGDDEVDAKFRHNAGSALPADQVEELLAAIRKIEVAPNLSDLASLLIDRRSLAL